MLTAFLSYAIVKIDTSREGSCIKKSSVIVTSSLVFGLPVAGRSPAIVDTSTAMMNVFCWMS